MDDVDYLVEDNARNDFCLSSEMGGTHGRLAQRLLRCKLGKNANVGNHSSNWGRTQQSRVSPLFEKVIT